MFHSKPYTPSANGAVERLNGTLKKLLILEIQKKFRVLSRRLTLQDSADCLRLAVQIYNYRVHTKTNARPEHLFYAANMSDELIYVIKI